MNKHPIPYIMDKHPKWLLLLSDKQGDGKKRLLRFAVLGRRDAEGVLHAAHTDHTACARS